MGKHSNIIVVDGKGAIVDSIKRVDASMSSLRMILPGLNYSLPTNQNKICLLNCKIEDLAEKIISEQNNGNLAKKILDILQGFSLFVCKEIEFSMNLKEILKEEQAVDFKKNLECLLIEFYEKILNFTGEPWLVLKQDGEFIDFSYLITKQYENMAVLKKEESFSGLLDKFFYERDKTQRIRVKAQDLLQVLARIEERLKKKISLQQKELSDCGNREKWKLCADLISANIDKIDSLHVERGREFVEIDLPNFYDEEMKPVPVRVNPQFTASRNAQFYYKKYKKAKTAEHILTEQINIAEQDLLYIDTVLDSINRSETEDELMEIKNELIEQGYLRKRKQTKNAKIRTNFLKFISKNGFSIFVGKNNKKNDELTLKIARNSDLWFHVKDMPGSHTVLFTEGKTVPAEDICQAAEIAALYSKAKNSANVPVDYTYIRYVSKATGAKPGMVIYKKNKTIYVTPKLQED